MPGPIGVGSVVGELGSVVNLASSCVFIRTLGTVTDADKVVDLAEAAVTAAAEDQYTEPVSLVNISMLTPPSPPFIFSENHQQALEALAARHGVRLAVRTNFGAWHEFAPTAATQSPDKEIVPVPVVEEKKPEVPTVVEFELGEGRVSTVPVMIGIPYEQDPSKQVSVSGLEKEIAAVRENLDRVFAEKLLVPFFLNKRPVFSTYLDDLLKGAIAAPRQRRENLIRFAAKSLAHTAAVVNAVLEESIAKDLPITFLPDPDELRPEDFKTPEAVEARADRMLASSVAELRDRLWNLRNEHGGAFATLGRQKPDSFGSGALSRLDLAGQVVRDAHVIADRDARLRFVAEAVTNGILPPTSLKFSRRDLNKVKAIMPIGHPTRSLEKMDEIFELKGEETVFSDMSLSLKEQLDSAINDFRNSVDFDRNAATQATLSMIFWKLRSDEIDACKTFLRLRLSRVLQMAPLDESVFDPMTGAKIEMIRKAIQDNDFAKADMMISCADKWFKYLQGVFVRVAELKTDLLLMGEQRALKSFSEVVEQLLNVNDVEGLEVLMNNMLVSMGGPSTRDIVVSLNETRFSGGVRAALTALIETSRVLALMPADQRTSYVRVLPPVSQMLEQGPFFVDASIRRLRRMGLPLPGDLNVAALPLVPEFDQGPKSAEQDAFAE